MSVSVGLDVPLSPSNLRSLRSPLCAFLYSYGKTRASPRRAVASDRRGQGRGVPSSRPSLYL